MTGAIAPAVQAAHRRGLRAACSKHCGCHCAREQPFVCTMSPLLGRWLAFNGPGWIWAGLRVGVHGAVLTFAPDTSRYIRVALRFSGPGVQTRAHCAPGRNAGACHLHPHTRSCGEAAHTTAIRSLQPRGPDARQSEALRRVKRRGRPGATCFACWPPDILQQARPNASTRPHCICPDKSG